MGTEKIRLPKIVREYLFDALCLMLLLGAAVSFLVPTSGGPSSAREARISVEVGNLSQAIGLFQAKYGVYPPDFSGDEEADRKAIDAMLERMREVDRLTRPVQSFQRGLQDR